MTSFNPNENQLGRIKLQVLHDRFAVNQKDILVDVLMMANKSKIPSFENEVVVNQLILTEDKGIPSESQIFYFKQIYKGFCQTGSTLEIETNYKQKITVFKILKD